MQFELNWLGGELNSKTKYETTTTMGVAEGHEFLYIIRFHNEKGWCLKSWKYNSTYGYYELSFKRKVN